MKKMKDYHDLYLKTGVMLLAEVFEEYRNVYSQYYELDLCSTISIVQD